jgi:hypothetical protein
VLEDADGADEADDDPVEAGAFPTLFELVDLLLELHALATMHSAAASTATPRRRVRRRLMDSIAPEISQDIPSPHSCAFALAC